MSGTRTMRRSAPCTNCGSGGPLTRFGDGNLYCAACNPTHLFSEPVEPRSRFGGGSISWPGRPTYRTSYA